MVKYPVILFNLDYTSHAVFVKLCISVFLSLFDLVARN